MRSKLILLLLTFSTLLTAQENYQYVFHKNHSRVLDIAVDDARLAAGGSAETCYQPLLALMNRDGSLNWEVNPFGECGYCWIDDVAFAENDDILAGGNWNVADDTGTPLDGFAIARFDTLGNQLAYRHLYPFFTHDPVNVMELPNGNIVAGINKYFFGFSPELDSLYGQTYDFESGEAILKIEVLNDSSLLLLTPFQVLVTDFGGEIQQSVPAPEGMTLIDLAVSGDELLFMSSTALYFYHLATAGISSIDLPQTARKGILLQSDTVMVWGEAVYRLDSNEEWQLLTEPYLNQKANVQMVYENGIVYRGGIATLELEPEQTFYRIFKTGFVESNTTLQSPPQPVKNLGLTGQINWELLNHNVYQDVPEIFINTYHIRVGVEVMNFGDDPVSSFVVGSEFLGGFNCAEGRMFAEAQVTLLPGESVFVEGEINEVKYSDSPNPNVTFERCFFVGAPDHEFDLNFGNNHTCGAVFVDTQNLAEDLNLQLYPNPASDLLHVAITPQHPIEAYTWINAAGQVINSQKVAPTSKLELTRPGLAGMYFLRVVSQGKTAIKRVNWQ